MNEKTKLNSNMQYPKFKVNVYCATFQHAKYITDAMNGFTMQQTDFPFVCTIIDDASTDGEQDVIKQYVEEHFDLSEDGVAYKKETDYAHIIYAQHKTNKNCYFAVLFLKENHYSQKKDKKPYLKEWRENVDYIALCEGDDYWIDPLKLQKQVKFLDENTEYTMCFHKVAILCYIQSISAWNQFNILDKDYNANEMFEKWIVPTCSIVMKHEVFDYPLKHREKILNGDIFIVLSSAASGKVRGFSQIMGVYRVSKSGITYNNDYNLERIMKYPSHIECIRENFSFLPVNIINKKLALYYWRRSKARTNYADKKNDKIAAIKAYPFIILSVLTKTIKETLKKIYRKKIYVNIVNR